MLPYTDLHHMPHRLEDCVTWKVPGTQWTLQGHSRGGERTGFYVPELRLGLDGGLGSYKAMRTVLLTHGHGDHSNSVCFLTHGVAMDVYGPPSIACAVSEYCRAFATLDGGAASGATFIPADTSSVITVTPSVVATVVDCVHTVPCLGFVLNTTSRKLLPEYHDAPKTVLALLRSQGVDVMGPKQLTPRLVFLGDTSTAVFDNEAMITLLSTTGLVVVIECTLLDPADAPESWTSRGHCSWSDLRPVVDAHPGVSFVLIHFSRRYTDADIVAYFAEKPSNVLLWLDSGVV